MILAYLLLFTGLTISAVAIYYSVVGLAAIFSAAVIPIIVMGSALEVAKLVCASWLKENWSRAPRLMIVYMTTAVVILMFITSMGIFGFLSKAHSDQSLVSGDVMSKISIYDEKIKTAKDNIDANRKALKQMDEAVDQVMGRSSDEKGADKAVAIRRAQQKERARLQSEIVSEQKAISVLNEEAAPIRAEVRKVEAEVGPLKYIAAFVYGETDETVLEKAVTWVIITIIIVFDPLAVIMLLAAQMTFGWNRKPKSISEFVPQPQELVIEKELAEGNSPQEPTDIVGVGTTVIHFEDSAPPTSLETPITDEKDPRQLEFDYSKEEEVSESVQQWNKMIEDLETEVAKETADTISVVKPYLPPVEGISFPSSPVKGQQFKRIDFNPTRDFVFNGSEWVDVINSQVDEQAETIMTATSGDRIKPDLTEVIETSSKKKSYMTKNPDGQIQVKTRD